MDGFFVAKFKVEKRTKKAAGEEDVPVRKLNDEGELVEDTAPSAFNDEADAEIIRESRRGYRADRRRW